MVKASFHQQTSPVHNGLTVDAEAVTAMQALIVVKDFFINLLTQRGPSDPASHSAKQTAQQRTGNAANGDPYRPTDHSQYGTGLRPR